MPPAPRRARPSVSGLRGPLSSLSAVEKRGRLAKVDTVTFVEAAAAPGPSWPVAGGGATGVVDQTLVEREPVRGHDAGDTLKLHTTCQVVHVERVGAGTVIDLVTLEDCLVGGQDVPAGAAVALGFDAVPLGAACQDLEAVMGYWEAIGALVDLEVVDVDAGRATRYRFSCQDGLALLVQAERP
jgi:hypothetical protein